MIASIMNHFFVNAWTKRVFLAQCVPDVRHATSKIRQVRSKLLKHRWGSVVAFVEQILECKDEIDEFWDEAKVSSGSSRGRDGLAVE